MKSISNEIKQKIFELSKLANYYSSIGNLEQVRELDSVIYSLAEDNAELLFNKYYQTLSTFLYDINAIYGEASRFHVQTNEQRATLNKILFNDEEIQTLIKKAMADLN